MDLALGDELTPGYDPKALNNRAESKALSKALGNRTVSKGIKNASLTIKNKGNLLHQLNQFSLPAYDRILLFYGSNDYLRSKASLGQIGKNLSKAIQIIHHKSRWIKIYGILPLPMYDQKGHTMVNRRGPAFYTLRDLMDMLRITYANNNVVALNWLTLDSPVVNQNNYQRRLIDGRYPKPQTYRLMAERIGTFVKKEEAAGYGKHPQPVRQMTNQNHRKPVIRFGNSK